MNKINKLYGYMLVEEEVFRIGTEEQIQEMIKQVGFPVWVKSLASYNMVLDYCSEGGQVEEGYYQVGDGTIETCGEEEDWEIVHISNKTQPNLKIVV